VARLIVLGSPGSGRSTFAYDMSGREGVRARFDSYTIAAKADDAVRMAREGESTIVLLIDYPRFKADDNYRTKSLAEAETLKKERLKFVVVGNKNQ